MSPQNTAASHGAMDAPIDTPIDTPTDTPLDTALRRHFDGLAEPDDNGFSQRVLAALPAQAAPRRAQWATWALHAHWAAISLAAGGLAMLASMTEGRADSAQGLATYALIGLLIFWAIPSRWSRG
jgi:hypothetical protein